MMVVTKRMRLQFIQRDKSVVIRVYLLEHLFRTRRIPLYRADPPSILPN